MSKTGSAIISKVVVFLITFTLILSLGSTLASAQDQGQDKLTVEEKIATLSLLWSEAKYNFAFFDQVPDVDWDSEYKKMIPKVLASETDFEYYQLLQRFMATLRDGHTAVLLPRTYRSMTDFPLIKVGEIEGKPVVVAVDKSLEGKIPLGSVILTIDGKNTMEYLAEDVMPYVSASTDHIHLDSAMRGNRELWIGMFLREKNAIISISYQTPTKDVLTAELQCNLSDVEVEWVGEQPQTELMKWKWINEDIAYVSFTSFMDEAVVTQFRGILPELKKAKGIVIDLRQNSGGQTNIGTDILDHFTTTDLEGSRWKTREHNAAWYAWSKNNENNELHDTYGTLNAWYEGGTMSMKSTDVEKLYCPVVVLQGYNTFSAAEDFLVFCDTLDNITLVGQPSNGSTGQPVIYRLPGGGIAAICAKRDTYPDGRDFVGYGVQPEVLIKPTIDSVAQGRDLVLEKGVEVLEQKFSK